MKWFWERGYYLSMTELIDRLNDDRYRPVEDFVVVFGNSERGYSVIFKYKKTRR